MEESKAWILEYKHRDSREHDVYWVSEIGLEAFSATDSLVVHVRIRYEISTECALNGDEPHFALSVPWFFNALLNLFQKAGADFYSGGRNVTSW